MTRFSEYIIASQSLTEAEINNELRFIFASGLLAIEQNLDITYQYCEIEEILYLALRFHSQKITELDIENAKEICLEHAYMLYMDMEFLNLDSLKANIDEKMFLENWRARNEEN